MKLKGKRITCFGIISIRALEGRTEAQGLTRNTEFPPLSEPKPTLILDTLSTFVHLASKPVPNPLNLILLP